VKQHISVTHLIVKDAIYCYGPVTVKADIQHWMIQKTHLTGN